MKIGRHALTPMKVLSGAAIVLGLALAAGGYCYYRLSQKLAFVQADFASSTNEFLIRVAGLEGQLLAERQTNAQLAQNLSTEKGKNDYFDFQLKNITGTVGVLDKLSKTDKELLAKYSKVYFLNENYAPASLTDISTSTFVHQQNKVIQIHADVWPHLQRLLQAATQDGMHLQVISAFRSFTEQSSLKSTYKFVYGSGTANQFSADQGYSEHQLGTTVDFTTTELGAGFEKFAGTLAYPWLRDHAHLYGFVLSYPEGNAYYEFEPWHWRYVGVSLATTLYSAHKNFYDLDQREIDQYLVSLF